MIFVVATSRLGAKSVHQWKQWLCCLFLVFATSPNFSGAEEVSRHEFLIKQITNGSFGHPELFGSKEEIDKSMLDYMVRPIFKQLRTEQDWGPEHPTWKRLFPAFIIDFKALTDSIGLFSESMFGNALEKNFNQKELEELAEFGEDPAIVHSLEIMKKFGIEPEKAFYLMGISSMPTLYSQEEKEFFVSKISALKSQEDALGAKMPELKVALQTFQKPVWVKYQKLILDTFLEAMKRVQADENARKQIQMLILKWHGKVNKE